MKTHTAFLGIGSNIEPERNIRSAVDALSEAFEAVRLSTAYRCTPVGFEGDDFINLVAAVQTTLPPLELNRVLHGIEDEHGRDRSVPRWSSRTLDIDILLYDDLWLMGPRLEIPRKEITEMAHVLIPLAELAPELVHPVFRKTTTELLAESGLSQAGLARYLF